MKLGPSLSSCQPLIVRGLCFLSLRFGWYSNFDYKRHIATNDDVLILGVHTALANKHDIQGLKSLMDMEKVLKSVSEPEDEFTVVMGDKGYKSKKDDQLLEDIGRMFLIKKWGGGFKQLTKKQKGIARLVRSVGDWNRPWWFASHFWFSGRQNEGRRESSSSAYFLILAYT